MNGTDTQQAQQAQAQAQQEQIVSLQVTLNEANVLLAGLGELPARVSMSLIDKIRNQAVNQLNKQGPAPVEGELVN